MPVIMSSKRAVGKYVGGKLKYTLAALVYTATCSGAALVSLKTLPVPEPLDLFNYVQDKSAAIRLGKALFWDMQVGSDGIQACASCHSHAGADDRSTNALNPGSNSGDNQFGNNGLGLTQLAPGALGPNQALTATQFPFHKLTDQDVIGEPLSNPGNVISDINDVVSSQGVTLMQFIDIVPGSPVDLGNAIPDPAFSVGGINVRHVQARNTPSVVNAAFNFSNFWDGRANNIFNGKNPFGPADPRSHLLSNASGSLQAVELRIRQSALASQAVGPPLSNTEMSWQGRTWQKIGKKMLSLKPLGQQQVHPTDSVLGFLADNTTGEGLTTSYATMIQSAFWPEFWSNTTQKVVFDTNGNPGFLAGAPVGTDEYTQMEANFGTFFGLAVQLYESTLVADDSKFDRFLEGSGSLTLAETRGMNTFNGVGGCIGCHGGAVMHDHDVFAIQGADPVNGVPQELNLNPLAANEFMTISTGTALYDNGFHNTGVRPGGAIDSTLPEFLVTNEDIGRGGMTGLGGSLINVPLSFGLLGLQEIGAILPPLPAHMLGWVPPLPEGFLPTDTTPFPNRVSNFGAFKTPGLRNVELSGPYMHNGGLSTLRQVVDFYTRGGDFPVTNDMDFDSAVLAIGFLRGSNQRKSELVQFMLTLTDERVKNESAPFDHPEIFVPASGNAPVSPGNRSQLLTLTTDFKHIPAVGSGGRLLQGMAPIGTFLGLNPMSTALITDTDLDGIADTNDNCPATANPTQDDGDGDGVGNACDNCTLVANADQRDTNSNGYGNMCDGDIDTSGGPVGLSDYLAFRSVYRTSASSNPPLSENADFDGDGTVGLSDYLKFRGFYRKMPGPSCCGA